MAAASLANAQAPGKTQNVILLMTDGLRWREVFQGADATLMNAESGHVTNVKELQNEYWRETPAARREALMPFLWHIVAKDGQIYGNQEKGSEAYVTNGLNFSYPGYNETLTGFADPRIRSNDKVPNPNVTVLEWLHRKPEYRGKVAAFGAWDVISAIVNAERSGVVTNAGFDAFTIPPVTPTIAALNLLKEETRVLNEEPLDAFTFHTALEYLKIHKPRVLYLSLGETDEWAHEARYDLYLQAAHRADQYARELWDTVQSMPEYRDSTTLIFLPDHGRGDGANWTSHGEKLPESKYIWMAFLGPDTEARGERMNVAPVTQNQLAATLAALLGEDYAGSVPQAGEPIADVLLRH